jgi:hypothetical protein
VELEVGGGEPRAAPHEREGLRNRRRQWPRPPQQPLEQVARLLGVSQRLSRDLPDARRIWVVLEIRAHPGRVDGDVEPVLAQVLGGPNPREHQQVRGGEGARREHDLAIRLGDVLAPAAVAVAHAGGAPARELDPARLGSGHDLEVLARAHGAQVGVVRAPAAPHCAGSPAPARRRPARGRCSRRCAGCLPARRPPGSARSAAAGSAHRRRAAGRRRRGARRRRARCPRPAGSRGARHASSSRGRPRGRSPAAGLGRRASRSSRSSRRGPSRAAGTASVHRSAVRARSGSPSPGGS